MLTSEYFTLSVVLMRIHAFKILNIEFNEICHKLIVFFSINF